MKSDSQSKFESASNFKEHLDKTKVHERKNQSLICQQLSQIKVLCETHFCALWQGHCGWSKIIQRCYQKPKSSRITTSLYIGTHYKHYVLQLFDISTIIFLFSLFPAWNLKSVTDTKMTLMKSKKENVTLYCQLLMDRKIKF